MREFSWNPARTFFTVSFLSRPHSRRLTGPKWNLTSASDLLPFLASSFFSFLIISCPLPYILPNISHLTHFLFKGYVNFPNVCWLIFTGCCVFLERSYGRASAVVLSQGNQEPQFIHLPLASLWLATGTRPHQPVHLQLAAVNGRAGAGEHAEAFQSGHFHTYPPWRQWNQPRSGLCQVHAFNISSYVLGQLAEVD